MVKYEAKFYDEDSSDCRLCVTNITEVRYRGNLVEFTTKSTSAPAVVVNMDKWMWFTLAKMED